MEKDGISALARITREYLTEIEDNTNVKLHLEPHVCIFKQIAKGKILASLLKIINVEDAIEYDLCPRADNHLRLMFIEQVFKGLKSNFINIGFISPLDVLELDQKLVFSLIKVLHHQIICRPDEKTIDISLLVWINRYTCFKKKKNERDIDSERISTDQLSEAGLCIDSDDSAFKELEYDDMSEISLECCNFSSDLKDGRVYVLLIARAFYFSISPVILMHIWNQEDSMQRVHYIIRLARFLGIENAITVNDIISGNIIANKLFIARLYSLHSVYNTKERITSLQKTIRKCRDHIIELRITIQSLNVQNSQLQETYRRTVLDIENERRAENVHGRTDARLESAIATAVRCMQSTVAPGVNLEGDTFPEQMWFVYLHNLEIISKYESKLCDLETENNILTKSNKVLKDIVAHYMNDQKTYEGKKTFFEKLINLFDCCTLEKDES